MPERRVYSPLHFDLMTTMSAITTRAFIEHVEISDTYGYNIADYQQASVFYAEVLSDYQSPIYLFEAIKDHIHSQFCEVVQLLIDIPSNEQESFVREIATMVMYTTIVAMGSKMSSIRTPIGTLTGGFGTGTSSLLMSNIYQQLYGKELFSSLKSSSELAKADLDRFAGALVALGFISEEMAAAFKGLQIQSTLLLLCPNASGSGYNEDVLSYMGYSTAEHSGCPALKAVPAQFAVDFPTISRKAAIPQLERYMQQVVTNTVRWIKEQGGTDRFKDIICEQDLSILNGTHPFLPVDESTGEAPRSLID